MLRAFAKYFGIMHVECKLAKVEFEGSWPGFAVYPKSLSQVREKKRVGGERK